MNKLFDRTTLAMSLTIGYATSAMASEPLSQVISVPEPTAVGFLTMGVAGLVLAKRLIKK